ncbi:MAG TPA: NAD(P)-dependent oxidoreductase [Gemmataceae bacterium]|nr:NAD(P)-dependent oxidoreductase [Gemmataceae bacterium]
MRGRVLLTGGTGLVGTDILSRLVEDNYEVISLSRRPPIAAWRQVNWIEADLAANHLQILNTLPAVDHVVHAAAAREAVTDADVAQLSTVNIAFTDALFDWAAAKRVATVVYISGFNFLRRPLAAVIDENHPVDPRTPYAASKLRGEVALAEHASQEHFRGVSLRVSSPVPQTYDLLHNTVLKTWIDQARQRGPVTVHGGGERTQDFVATMDVAAAVVLALENSAASGLYNIASGTSVSMLDLAHLIAARWRGPVVFEGTDVNEGERWNISIDKARGGVRYRPQFNSRSAIERLLASIS